jgi:SAM-dependent methyltransferase
MNGLLEHPAVYGFTQKLNPMTVGLYRHLVVEHVRVRPGGAVLDIGCGVGAHVSLFPDARYVGIDVNPAYIDAARKAHGDRFRVMDAGALDFAEGSFDAVFTVATCHHLDDQRILAMVRSGLRVLTPGGSMHIVDPVWPVSGRAPIKRALFGHDRGRFQRSVAELTSLLARYGSVCRVDVRAGLLHDVCYVGLEAVPK